MKKNLKNILAIADSYKEIADILYDVANSRFTKKEALNRASPYNELDIKTALDETESFCKN